MKTKYVDLAKISSLSKRDVSYATQEKRIHAFQKYTPQFESFDVAVQNRQNKVLDRSTLVDDIRQQYEKLGNVSPHTRELIASLLADNTYTIITAHQPSLFTGPLYFVYKIISALKLSRQLNARNGAYKVIPFFIIGGEDHDFEEINHLHLFGKKVTWTDNQGGSTGEYDTSSMGAVIDYYRDILGESTTAQDLDKKILEPFRTHQNYGLAVQQMVHNLFGDYGVLSARMNSRDQKSKMTDIFWDDITNHTSLKIVTNTQKALEAMGLPPQAYVRDINLFYKRKHYRERIITTHDGYTTLDQKYTFTKQALRQELEEHPERFSPNVILRPIFQEAIFPNLAYIGGGGELAYWLERKDQFEQYGIDFPILVRRDSALWISRSIKHRIDKLGLTIDDFFDEKDRIIARYVEAQSDVDLSLDTERETILETLKKIETKAEKIDTTLGPFLAGEAKKIEKLIHQYESRMRRAAKAKNDTAVGQITKIKDALFPENGLQERHTNMAEIYLHHGVDFFERLIDAFDPLDTRFKIILEEE